MIVTTASYSAYLVFLYNDAATSNAAHLFHVAAFSAYDHADCHTGRNRYTFFVGRAAHTNKFSACRHCVVIAGGAPRNHSVSKSAGRTVAFSQEFVLITIASSSLFVPRHRRAARNASLCSVAHSFMEPRRIYGCKARLSMRAWEPTTSRSTGNTQLAIVTATHSYSNRKHKSDYGEGPILSLMKSKFSQNSSKSSIMC